MRAIIAALAIAVVAGGCAGKDKQWVKEGAGPNTVRSDMYWCSRTTVEKYTQTNAPILGVRKVERDIDPECMRKRGYRLE